MGSRDSRRNHGSGAFPITGRRPSATDIRPTFFIDNEVVEVAQELHAEEDVTLGMRAVLENILLEGPGTVPEIAHRRRVTRQHIQVLVNELLELGLVSLEANPKHKHSHVVCMTTGGERTIQRMRQREQRWFAQIDTGIAPGTLRKTTSTLEKIRLALEESQS